VVAAASSWFAALVQTNNSRLHTTFGGAGSSMLNGEATIVVTNDGSKVGVFDAAMLRVNWKASQRDLSFDIPPGEGRTVPIRPGTQTTLQLAIGLSAKLDGSTTSTDAQALLTPKTADDYSTAPLANAVCLIRTNSTDSTGKAQVDVQPVVCLPFASWLADSIRPIK
jgi:hypothetical protein